MDWTGRRFQSVIHIHTNYKPERLDESFSEGACFMYPTLDLGNCSKLKLLLVCVACGLQSTSSLCLYLNAWQFS